VAVLDEGDSIDNSLPDLASAADATDPRWVRWIAWMTGRRIGRLPISCGPRSSTESCNPATSYRPSQ
jgi:hypothetical protein